MELKIILCVGFTMLIYCFVIDLIDKRIERLTKHLNIDQVWIDKR